jgi:hypothetical protein
MSPIENPNQSYRTVLQITEKPSGSGIHSSEKFTVRDNSSISWVVLRRGRRILPIVPRSAKMIIELREADRKRPVKNVMPDYRKGKIKLHGNTKGHTVIHETGTFYLHIKWGSLVREWEVKVEEPIG